MVDSAEFLRFLFFIFIIQFTVSTRTCNGTEAVDGTSDCIVLPILNVTFREINHVCDFLRQNAALIFVGSALYQDTNLFIKIIHEHCQVVMLNLNISLVNSENRWTEYTSMVSFNPPLCKGLKEIPKLHNFFRATSIRTIEIRKISGKMLHMKLSENFDFNLKICEVNISKCFDESTAIASSLTIEMRRFAPFTIAETESIPIRGIEVMLIGSIAPKINVQLNYISVNSSAYQR